VTNITSDQISATILIAGAGQLGSRYLQGMANCPNTMDIYVYDISKRSLQIAKERWEQLFHAENRSFSEGLTESPTQHKVTFLNSFEKIPNQVDIAIVATNSDVRPQVVKQIVTNCGVRFWILEKVLAQSEGALEEIASLTRNSAGAWVNICRRIMTWHQQIHKNLQNVGPLHVRRSGSHWGLACNGIHFLDLVSWWAGEKLIKIDSSELDTKWIGSKRNGFFEISGKITAVFSEGSTLILESRLDGPPISMEVYTQVGTWKIDELNGVASKADGVSILGKIEMQNSMTSGLIDSLLTDRNCDLPNLSDSVLMHRIFLRSLLDHWNNVHGTNVDTLPIT